MDDVDAPVHVDLEIHNDERHPDYETVSYTWGGENGDSTLCRPVYVGKHWDVLVQTLNCQEMLRYLHPRRDVRTIWVDAICINQRDLNERQTQVAKMGSVFESAVRTIVYLGPDIVLPTSTSSPYPRRHYLQDLDILSDSSRPIMRRLKPSQHITLTTLFDRNYFQRLGSFRSCSYLGTSHSGSAMWSLQLLAESVTHLLQRRGPSRLLRTGKCHGSSISHKELLKMEEKIP